MAVPNYDSRIVDAIWVLLEASRDVTGIVTKPRNRQNQSLPQGWLKDLFVEGAAADYPLIKIILGDFSGGAFTQEGTYATERIDYSPADPGWPLSHDTEIVIVLVTRNPSLADQNALEAAVLKALLSAGPHLGLNYVNGWTYRGRRQVTNRDEAKGSFRCKTTLRLRVQQEFQGAAFIAAT